MFTECRTTKFPLLQEIMDFKHYRHTGGKKEHLLETVEYISSTVAYRYPQICSRSSIYVLHDKRDR